MMRLSYLKMRVFFKTVWNGILGISAEILLISILISVGFLVCLVWWSISR